jgi:hypothetical protein
VAVGIRRVDWEAGADALRLLSLGAEELGADVVGGTRLLFGHALDYRLEAVGWGRPAGWDSKGAGIGEKRLFVTDHLIELLLREPYRTPEVRELGRGPPV